MPRSRPMASGAGQGPHRLRRHRLVGALGPDGHGPPRARCGTRASRRPAWATIRPPRRSMAPSSARSTGARRPARADVSTSLLANGLWSNGVPAAGGALRRRSRCAPAAQRARQSLSLPLRPLVHPRHHQRHPRLAAPAGDAGQGGMVGRCALPHLQSRRAHVPALAALLAEHFAGDDWEHWRQSSAPAASRSARSAHPRPFRRFAGERKRIPQGDRRSRRPAHGG